MFWPGNHACTLAPEDIDSAIFTSPVSLVVYPSPSVNLSLPEWQKITAMPNTAQLEVVFFKLIEGNFDHWALWLHHGPIGYNKLFQVAGDYTEMEAQALDEDPRENVRFYQRIAIGDILHSDIPSLETCVQRVPVQNGVALWDCQDYVLDVLDALEIDGFVGDDQGYARLRRRSRSFRRPTDETRHLVEQYHPDRLGEGDHHGLSSSQEHELHSDEDVSLPKTFLSAERVVDSDSDEG